MVNRGWPVLLSNDVPRKASIWDILPERHVQQDKKERVLHTTQDLQQRSDTDRQAAQTGTLSTTLCWAVSLSGLLHTGSVFHVILLWTFHFFLTWSDVNLSWRSFVEITIEGGTWDQSFSHDSFSQFPDLSSQNSHIMYHVRFQIQLILIKNCNKTSRNVQYDPHPTPYFSKLVYLIRY